MPTTLKERGRRGASWRPGVEDGVLRCAPRAVCWRSGAGGGGALTAALRGMSLLTLAAGDGRWEVPTADAGAEAGGFVVRADGRGCVAPLRRLRVLLAHRRSRVRVGSSVIHCSETERSLSGNYRCGYLGRCSGKRADGRYAAPIACPRRGVFEKRSAARCRASCSVGLQCRALASQCRASVCSAVRWLYAAARWRSSWQVPHWNTPLWWHWAHHFMASSCSSSE